MPPKRPIRALTTSAASALGIGRPGDDDDGRLAAAHECDDVSGPPDDRLRERCQPRSVTAVDDATESGVCRRHPRRHARGPQLRTWRAAQSGRAACLPQLARLQPGAWSRRQRQLAGLDGQLPDWRRQRHPGGHGTGSARAGRTLDVMARAALVSLPRLHGDDADGTGAGDVGPAACRQVEVLDLDEAQRAAARRFLAQWQRGGLLGAHKAHRHRPVLPHHAVGLVLGPRDHLGCLAYRGDGWSMPRHPRWKLSVGISISRTKAADNTCCPVCCCMWSQPPGPVHRPPRPACRRRGARPGRARRRPSPSRSTTSTTRRPLTAPVS